MSFSLDVNILLYASNASSHHQAKAVAFLERCAQRREVFCVAWTTVMSYLRMATHPSIFETPLSHDEAARNIGALLALPHCRAISEDGDFWNIYRNVTQDVPTRGTLVPDAHLAAILRSHGVKKIYTHDRDFLKFSFLRVEDPLV
jgi:uncharacterized protein